LKGILKDVLLTFDVEGPHQREDFINGEVLTALYDVLKLLKKYDLKGLFFITGSVAEKVACYPKILELLKTHEIGYHSSSHSVKPGIFEYTDIKNYEEAVEISMKRETSCIDPFTGSIKGEGGILLLRQIFPEKKITSFRAPFFCWSPPHLEALKELGFRFDFSTSICNVPVLHKGITIMPYPIMIDLISGKFYVIIKKILSEKFPVFVLHPSRMIFKQGEPFYRQYNNSFHPIQIKKRTRTLIKFKFSELELFLSGLCSLQRNGLIKVKNSLEESKNPLDLERVDISKVYEKSVCSSEKFFGYKPKFLLSHFYHFLGPESLRC